MILAISSNHDYYYVYCIIHVATQNLAVTPDQGPGNEADVLVTSCIYYRAPPIFSPRKIGGARKRKVIWQRSAELNIYKPQRDAMQRCSFLPTAALLVLLRLVSATPLDDYVNKPDPTYTYKDLGHSFRGDGYTSYFINMTSQTWLSRK